MWSCVSSIPLAIIADKKVIFQNNAAYYYCEINIFQPTCFGRKEFEICFLFTLILSTDNRIFFSHKLRRTNTPSCYECMIVSSQWKVIMRHNLDPELVLTLFAYLTTILQILSRVRNMLAKLINKKSLSEYNL